MYITIICTTIRLHTPLLVRLYVFIHNDYSNAKYNDACDVKQILFRVFLNISLTELLQNLNTCIVYNHWLQTNLWTSTISYICPTQRKLINKRKIEDIDFFNATNTHGEIENSEF